MPRRSLTKPWFHAASSFYCTSIDGKRVYLDRNYRVACRKLRDIRQRQNGREPARDWLEEPFADLADELLDDVRARKKPATYASYRHRLSRALPILGTDLRVGAIRRRRLAAIERELTSLSPTTVRDTIAAVQSVFGWAVRYDLLDVNPLSGYQKPAPRMRTRVMEAAEFRALLRHSDPSFRRFLFALAMTGCRPTEVRSLVWEWVDLDNGFWILSDHKTITRQRHPRPRVIPLPDVIWKLCRRLAQTPHESTDFVFLNTRAKPYTKDCLCRKMARVRVRAGIETRAGERLVLYSLRHTFGTETSGTITDIELWSSP